MRIEIPKKNEKKKAQKEADIEWSRAVRTRDNYQCLVCGSSERSNAHHILVRECKKYKYDVDNGVTLCVTHHKFSRRVSAHNNALPFFVVLMAKKPELYNKAFERSLEIVENET